MCPKCKSADNVEKFLVDAANHDTSDGPIVLYHCMCACGEEWVE